MEAPPSMIPSCSRCGRKLEHDICYACAVVGDPLLVMLDKIGTCWYCEWPLLLPRIVCAFCSDKFEVLCVICSSDARYGLPFENKNDSIRSHVKHCSKHKELGEVDLLSTHCKGTEGKACYTQPRFCKIGEKRATHCKACIDPADFHNWISVRRDKCEKCKNVRASYGKNGKATHCGSCKDNDMSIIHVAKCFDKKCKTIPLYGFPGSLRGTHCYTHKTEGMVDVVHHMCTYPGCDTRASFGKPGTKSFEFCEEHKPDDYIDVVSKRCKECPERAYYGISTITHCYTHKTTAMKKIGGFLCARVEKGNVCKTIASYGFTTDHVPIRCAVHKDELMVNVVSCKCITEGCKSNASFGQLFRKATHCKEHSRVGEFSNTHPKCKLCNAKAFYSGKQEDLPQYCAIHAPKGYINLVESKCSACGMEDRIPEGETQCYMCRGYKDDNVRKKKEFAVKALLDVAGVKYSQHDRRVDEGCSRYRPDFVIDCVTFMLVVECDENQHSSYAPECEKGRMLQLFQDFGMPVQFIRYNPDTYTNSKGKRIVIQGSRETLLVDTIKHVTRWEVPKFQVGAIYICYNGFDGVPKNVDMDYDGYMKSMGKATP